MAENEAFISFEHVSRSFGQTKAVKEVSFDLAIRGRVHALVGENGAGKSTCLGMAAGRIAPSTGRIRIDGKIVPGGSPKEAIRLGVQAIYQELTVLPALTPRANVFLGQPITKGGWLLERTMQERYEELCARVGVAPMTVQRSGDLSIADQQVIEILRALASNAQCILFDEPTASLALAEREALFSTMRKLREEGIAMTIVGHNLDEIQEHSDIISVFRDGSLVETRESTAWTKTEMVQAMLGNHAHGADIAAGKHQSRAGTARSESAAQEVAMEVRELSSPGLLHDIGFTLHRGEILGIAGLVGSGRTELLRALAGADPSATGALKTFLSPSETLPKNVVDARSRGISLQPEDRKGQGLLLSQSATDNIVLGEWKRESGGLFLDDGRLKEAAARAAAPVGYNTTRMAEIAGNLPGGNQQKLLIARWLYTDFPILLADEPTRGVDVGAKSEILEALEEIVASGRSIIVVSSELEEVVGLSDRVLVMHEGRILATLDAATDTITPERILELIFGTADSSL